MPGLVSFALCAASVLTACFLRQNLKDARLRLADAVFWTVCAVVFACMGLFPALCVRLAEKFGLGSPVEFVFLVVIILLGIRCCLLSVRLARLEGKFEMLVGEWAVRENARDAHNRLLSANHAGNHGRHHGA